MPSFVEGYNDPDKIAKSPAEQMKAMGGGEEIRQLFIRVFLP